MPSSADDTPDVGAAVRALMPHLRQSAALSVLLLLALAVASGAMAVWAITLSRSDSDNFKLVMALAMLGFAAIIYVWIHARRAQEALVMPVVAQAVGLSYAKNAKPFLAALPPRLLPQKAVQTAEDHVQGRLGNHMIQMAEVSVVTGGKNSKTLFNGLVARFPNSIAMPPFFLAPMALTRPGVIFDAWMPTDGLHPLRTITGSSGGSYGLWTPWTSRDEPPALAAVVKVLTELESRVGVPATLFSAVSDGAELFLALSHAGDLYRIGGLFPTEASVFRDVEAATRELSIMLNLAGQLIAAEEAAASAG